MTSNAPAWLTARPIAHRGLHNAFGGLIENSVSAARAAITHGFAIECDVQLSSDGEAMVFHDHTLDRLTGITGDIGTASADVLKRTVLTGSTDTIPTLAMFLVEIGGRVPLILEIKSRFDGDMRLTKRVLDVVGAYDGPVALKSFDPRILAELRASDTKRPCGIVSAAELPWDDFAVLSAQERHAMANLLHLAETRPDFLSWRVRDLPGAAPYLCRTLGRMPVMTWTVRTDEDRQLAATHADQMVFEGFVPAP